MQNSKIQKVIHGIDKRKVGGLLPEKPMHFQPVLGAYWQFPLFPYNQLRVFCFLLYLQKFCNFCVFKHKLDYLRNTRLRVHSMYQCFRFCSSSPFLHMDRHVLGVVRTPQFFFNNMLKTDK